MNELGIVAAIGVLWFLFVLIREHFRRRWIGRTVSGFTERYIGLRAQPYSEEALQQFLAEVHGFTQHFGPSERVQKLRREFPSFDADQLALAHAVTLIRDMEGSAQAAKLPRGSDWETAPAWLGLGRDRPEALGGAP